MNSRRLPPLNALRAFEAAARHLHVTRAAEELNVTQAAVSHQVRALEAWLGVRLFQRAGRGLRLTEPGSTYLVVLRDAFDRIAAATAALARGRGLDRLTVSSTDSFAAIWLVPRLRRFRAAHPDIEVRVMPSDEMVDFDYDDVDIAVRYGRGVWPGVKSLALFADELFPVCSPALLEGPHPLRTPDDIRHHVLLHDVLAIDWDVWLKAAGVKGVDSRRGPFFSHTHLVLQAARSGEGLALGDRHLVAPDLAAGTLVKPFELSLETGYAYYAVAPEQTWDSAKVTAFRDWLVAEAGAD
jgi:LysR family glycine cleavage system transcriptional activator